MYAGGPASNVAEEDVEPCRREGLSLAPVTAHAEGWWCSATASARAATTARSSPLPTSRRLASRRWPRPRRPGARRGAARPPWRRRAGRRRGAGLTRSAPSSSTVAPSRRWPRVHVQVRDAALGRLCGSRDIAGRGLARPGLRQAQTPDPRTHQEGIDGAKGADAATGRSSSTGAVEPAHVESASRHVRDAATGRSSSTAATSNRPTSSRPRAMCATR